jgi:hypothetical protein
VLLAKENNQVAEYEISRDCSTNEKKRKLYRILVGNPEGKRLLRILKQVIR